VSHLAYNTYYKPLIYEYRFNIYVLRALSESRDPCYDTFLNQEGQPSHVASRDHISPD
jgi:hypothetical protein